MRRGSLIDAFAGCLIRVARETGARYFKWDALHTTMLAHVCQLTPSHLIPADLMETLIVPGKKPSAFATVLTCKEENQSSGARLAELFHFVLTEIPLFILGYVLVRYFVIDDLLDG